MCCLVGSILVINISSLLWLNCIIILHFLWIDFRLDVQHCTWQHNQVTTSQAELYFTLAAVLMSKIMWVFTSESRSTTIKYQHFLETAKLKAPKLITRKIISEMLSDQLMPNRVILTGLYMEESEGLRLCHAQRASGLYIVRYFWKRGQLLKSGNYPKFEPIYERAMCPAH